MIWHYHHASFSYFYNSTSYIFGRRTLIEIAFVIFHTRNFNCICVCIFICICICILCCTSCIWPAGSDRNCFCHLSPEEFSSFSKKFAQLLPATASDNQFINISNPDPFTLLKLISTKYVFPKSCSQIPIPIQFFCQPNFIELHEFNKSFHLEKGQKNSLNYPKLCWWWNWMDGNFLHLKSRFSVSLVALSLIFVLENSKPDPEA